MPDLQRYFRPLLYLLLAIITGCQDKPADNQPTDPWPYGTMYEIFVQSFADSNGDGIGDINGLTAKLDYLQELGIQGIWLMPINPSPSYHKYDVTDYYDIHPDYGTMADFKRFLAAAHQRRIRVVMDLVVNHTSSEHPWFKAAVADPNSPYRNYYVWADIDSIRDQIAKKEITLDSDNITQWHQATGNEQYYYGFFWGGMPDLNYDNPAVREEIKKIGRYWLEEVGVDGFRLDAAKHIYPDERAADSHAWWIEFGEAMREVKPDVYLVGEVWGDARLVAPYLQGLPSMFNFDFYHNINRIVKNEREDSLIASLIKARQYFAAVQPRYLDAVFVNNHDQNRLISNVNGHSGKARLAAAILLTLPDIPYVYYGDEIGMLGKKPDPQIREPFIWDYDQRAAEQTTWIKAVNSTDSTVVPLAAQINDPASTYAFYKYWIAQRNRDERLRTGKLRDVPVADGLLAYQRGDLLIVHNLTGLERSLELRNFTAGAIKYAFAKGVNLDSEGNLRLPPYTSVVLQ
ncbi:MAG TPA: alpha-amylase [Flammeovirgaceae bacterium]|nr:alpha-amylase [Flammeovirgaceae bacterium]